MQGKIIINVYYLGVPAFLRTFNARRRAFRYTPRFTCFVGAGRPCPYVLCFVAACALRGAAAIPHAGEIQRSVRWVERLKAF